MMKRMESLQTLLMELCGSFIGVPPHQVDEVLHQALEKMGLFLEADRVCVFRCERGTDEIRHTHEWCREGIISGRETMKHLPAPAMAPLREAHEKGDLYYAADAAQVKEAPLHSYLQHRQVQSMVSFPMMENGTCLGWISLEAVRHKRQLEKEETTLLAGFAHTIIKLLAQQRTDHQLQETKEQLASVLDYSHDVILRFDQEDTITFANQAYCDLMGRGRDQVVGRPLWELVIPENHASVRAHLETLKKTGEVRTYTNWLQDAKGENRWFEWTDHPVRDHQGNIVEYQSVGHDMTHRFVLEQHLLESESRYRSVIAASGTGAWEYHRQRQYLWCSPQYFQMLGYDPEDFLMDGTSNLEEAWVSLIHPEDRERAAAAFASHLEEDQKEMYDNTFRVRCHDGSWAWIWSRGQTLKNPDGTFSDLTVGTHINVTEQKRLEETIAHSERTHRELFHSTLDALFIHDIDTGEILDVNDTMLTLFGYEREELPSLSLVKLSHVDDPHIGEKAHALIKRCAAGEDVTFQWVCRRKNGEMFPTENHLHRVTIGGQPRIMATVRDITQRKELEKELEEKRNLLDSMFHSIQDGISILNPDLTIRDVNHTMHKLYHHAEPLIGKKCHEAYRNRRKPCEACPSMKALQEKTMCSEVVPLVMDGQHKGWHEVFAYPLISQSTGEVEGVVEFVRDITQRVKQEEALRLQNGLVKSLLNSMPDLVFYKDLEGVHLGGNSAYANYLGIPMEEIPGKTDYDLHPKEEADLYRYHDRKVLQSLSTRLNEEWVTYPDGRRVLLETLKTPYLDEENNLIGLLGIARDITDRKEAEEKLQAFAAEMEMKNTELDVALYQAQAADEAKAKYLATMNHEIRTPLNGLAGFLQLLEQTSLDEAQASYVGYMNRSASHLLEIVNEVLDMGKIEAGEMQLDNRPFHLMEEVHTALSSLRPLAGEKNLQLVETLDPHLPEWLEGDPQRLRQIIVNLAGNALKFTEKGSVHLSFTSLGREEGLHHLHLEVRDTGPGMDQATQDKLFQPFYQAGGHQHGGTGLGLPITKELVEMMGGRIQVHSQPGKGSTFTVRLSLKEASQPPEKTVSQPALRRVLVVEDQEVNQLLLKQLLDQRGIDHDLAKDGEAAVAMAAQSTYDLVLMDLQLPGMDGLEAARQIRNITGIHQPRIIALTGNATRQDQEASQAAGMDDFLVKPFTPAHLDRVLNQESPGQVPHSLPQDEPGWDRWDIALENMMEQAGMEEEGAKQLLQIAVQSNLRLAADCLEAVKSGEEEQVSRGLHKLKGSAGNLFLSATAERAALAEHFVAAGDRDLLVETLLRMRENLVQLAREGAHF